MHESKLGTGRHYGWRPSLPDHRDVAFIAHRATLVSLPTRTDLAVPTVQAPFEPCWNQGSLGSCGPNSSCADIVFAALKQQGFSSVPMPSRLFTYWCVRKVMGTIGSDSGVDNRSMLKALAQYGWCDESLWPYDVRRFRETPPNVCFTQAAERKVDQYLAVPQDLEQMKACLAGGDPFIFGFTVFSSFESEEVSRTGNVPMPRRGESQVGGHDVLMVGYDDSVRKFKFKNSWGTQWGENGYGYFPYEYATHPQLAADFWTVRHSTFGPVNPTPPPIPTPSPVDGDVAYFTLLDREGKMVSKYEVTKKVA